MGHKNVPLYFEPKLPRFLDFYTSCINGKNKKMLYKGVRKFTTLL